MTEIPIEAGTRTFPTLTLVMRTAVRSQLRRVSRITRTIAASVRRVPIQVFAQAPSADLVTGELNEALQIGGKRVSAAEAVCSVGDAVALVADAASVAEAACAVGADTAAAADDIDDATAELMVHVSETYLRLN